MRFITIRKVIKRYITLWLKGYRIRVVSIELKHKDFYEDMKIIDIRVR